MYYYYYVDSHNLPCFERKASNLKSYIPAERDVRPIYIASERTVLL